MPDIKDWRWGGTIARGMADTSADNV